MNECKSNNGKYTVFFLYSTSTFITECHDVFINPPCIHPCIYQFEIKEAFTISHCSSDIDLEHQDNMQLSKESVFQYQRNAHENINKLKVCTHWKIRAAMSEIV